MVQNSFSFFDSVNGKILHQIKTTRNILNAKLSKKNGFTSLENPTWNHIIDKQYSNSCYSCLLHSVEMEKKFQNREENEQFNLSNDGSICGYDSLHLLLKDNLKPHHFQVTLLSHSNTPTYNLFASVTHMFMLFNIIQSLRKVNWICVAGSQSFAYWT